MQRDGNDKINVRKVLRVVHEFAEHPRVKSAFIDVSQIFQPLGNLLVFVLSMIEKQGCRIGVMNVRECLFHTSFVRRNSLTCIDFSLYSFLHEGIDLVGHRIFLPLPEKGQWKVGLTIYAKMPFA